jgi:hypothetical protein
LLVLRNSAPVARAGPGEIYCALADCLACKQSAPPFTPLDAPETLHWHRMREAGRLGIKLREAGVSYTINRA